VNSRKLFFPNGRGQTLAAYLEEPQGSGGTYGIFAHCFTCSKDYRAVFHISRELARSGIGILRFDFTGLGESEGDFSKTNFSSNVEDLLAAAKFLEARFGAPRVLLGHSLGGAAAIVAARRVAGCRAVVALCAPFEPAGGGALGRAGELARQAGEAEVSIGGRSFRLSRAFFEDLDRVRVDSAVRALGKPLLLFHSPQDQVVEFESGLRIFEAAASPKSFVSVEGADHLLSAAEDARFVAALTRAWLERYLPSP
jgi:alpha-beta hydrolase superfamily lysophospholipase